MEDDESQKPGEDQILQFSKEKKILEISTGFGVKGPKFWFWLIKYKVYDRG